MPSEEDCEEGLAAAVGPGSAPEGAEEGAFPGVHLGGGPVRGLRAVHHRGAGLCLSHASPLVEAQRKVADAAQGCEGLSEALGDVRGLFCGRGEGEVGPQAASDGPHREVLVVEPRRSGVGGGVEAQALLGVQGLARDRAEGEGDGAGLLPRSSRA